MTMTTSASRYASFIAACVTGLILSVFAARSAIAFDNYAGGCDDCHGDYRAANYVSLADGTAWNTSLMAGHISFIDGDAQAQCNTCHLQIGQAPVLTNSSGNPSRPLSCAGCHGRDEDITPNDGAFGGATPGRTDGLRAHHMGSDDYLNWEGGIPGGLTCAQCHSADTTPVGEDVQPFNFLASGGNVLALLDAACADAQFGTTGLDNDGDQVYDGADADCKTPGDMDGDGKSDILWRNSASGQNALWTMDGGTRLANLAVPSVIDTTWQIVGRGDYNGDAMADILWRKVNVGQPDNGQMAIWLMQGNTRIGNLALLTVSDQDWQVVGTGDSNGDGHADILWRNVANGQNAHWQINDGLLTANLGVPQVSDLNWVIVSNGDFDNDSKADILWRNSSTGQMALWRMNGAMRIANEAVPGVADANWVLMADGDYNGDKKSDLFWRNISTGQNAVWLMDGSTRTDNLPTVSFSNANWQVLGDDGDYDGDGKADLFWRESTTGENSMWLMSSGMRIGHDAMPGVSIFSGWNVARID